MLYHGSNHKIEGQLQPHVSFDLEPLVYATDDYRYAVVRAGRFNIEEFLIKEDYFGDNQPIRLVEIEPGAFKRTFNTKGYIYSVQEKFFEKRNNEHVSIDPVNIQYVQVIFNVWEEIQQRPQDYQLIYYEDSDAYWQTVNGGKEEYLKRRATRVAEIKKHNAQFDKYFATPGYISRIDNVSNEIEEIKQQLGSLRASHCQHRYEADKRMNELWAMNLQLMNHIDILRDQNKEQRWAILILMMIVAMFIIIVGTLL